MSKLINHVVRHTEIGIYGPLNFLDVTTEFFQSHVFRLFQEVMKIQF